MAFPPAVGRSLLPCLVQTAKHWETKTVTHIVFEIIFKTFAFYSNYVTDYECFFPVTEKEAICTVEWIYIYIGFSKQGFSVLALEPVQVLSL